MRRSLVSIGAVLAFAVGITASASAQAKDYAATALNIIPSGQYGGARRPRRRRHPGEDVRRPDAALRPGHRRRPDHLLQVGALRRRQRRPRARSRPCRAPASRSTRDSYNVPHVTGATHDDGVWAAGWIAAEDRGLLLQQARYNARVAAIDAPGLERARPDHRAEELPAQRPDRGRGRQADARCSRPPGPEGQAVLHDIDIFITRDQRLPRRQRLVERAVDAQRRLRPERAQGPVRRPGRRRRGAALAVPRRPAASGSARRRAERLRRPAPVQEPRAADLGRRQLPLRARSPRTPKGSVILDPGSYQPTPGGRRPGARREAPPDSRRTPRTR